MIKGPMKCISLEDEWFEQFFNERDVILGSPKLDGIRCLVFPDGARTSSLKPQFNEYVRKCLNKQEYVGLDGELVVGDPTDPTCYNGTTGPIRRKKGEPDFTFHVFDDFTFKDDPYQDRFIPDNYKHLPFVNVLEQVPLTSVDEAIEYEAKMLARGYEGVMLRDPEAAYKEGRTTKLEWNMFKRKPLLDAEAEILYFEEQNENLNEAKINELGHTERSSHKENKRGKGTLGAFIVQIREKDQKKYPNWTEPFRIGTGKGLTKKLRQEIWDNKEEYEDLLVKFTYQGYGSINAPRIPIWIGFRDKDDTTDY